MNLLLDTHILLWWLDDHPSLTPRCRSAIANGSNLIAQAQVEDFTVVTHDSVFRKYRVAVLAN